MKRLNRIVFTNLIIIGTFFPCVAMAADITCNVLKDATPQKYLAYLEHDRSTLDPQCIEFAIYHLGQLRYLPAIRTLIQYLDVKTLAPVYMNARLPLAGRYPAATALGEIDKFAIPDVKRAIKDESLNRIQRRNAAELYGRLSADDPANIAFLVQASKESKDEQVALDLMDLAKKFADTCPPNNQEQCYDALNGK